jgi:hypothetical protein
VEESPAHILRPHFEERILVQRKPQKRPYTVVIEFEHGMTRNVKVKATSREVAEHKALKFHPTAKGVKRNA